MSNHHHDKYSTLLWQRVFLASLAGGIAEIIWVSLYAAFNPLALVSVAREVTASLLPRLAEGRGRRVAWAADSHVFGRYSWVCLCLSIPTPHRTAFI